MKVLIGTPIHISKDYSMDRWLDNVAQLTALTPADLLLVDNSPDSSYVEKVKQYCQKHQLKNYEIIHIELGSEQNVFERVARSREIIRNHLLKHDYDAWFSWECDQIIPTNTLKEFIKLMNSSNVTIVSHNSWTREVPDLPLFELFGVTLINKSPLEKYSFIIEFGADPDMPPDWERSERWFSRQLLRDGGSCILADGWIKPIYHLDK